MKNSSLILFYLYEFSDFSFCYSLLGHEFSRIDNFSASSTSPEFWSLSPTSRFLVLLKLLLFVLDIIFYYSYKYIYFCKGVLHLAQNRFEAALRDELERLRPRGYCRTLFGYSVSNVSHNNTTGWNLSLNSLEMNKFSTSSGPSSLSLYPKYLVAADGANSLVRRQLGIELVGREDMQTLVNVHFICRGLRDKLKRPAMLYFVFNEVCDVIILIL